MMNIGALVKEKEGPRTCGIIIEVTERAGHPYVKVVWPNGKKAEYKSTFLEEVKSDNAN
jgi:hypothetical protein